MKKKGLLQQRLDRRAKAATANTEDEELAPDSGITSREWTVSNHSPRSKVELEFLLAGARFIADRNLLIKTLEESPNPPTKLSELDTKPSLAQHIQTEWLNKRFDPTEIELAYLRGYDPELLALLEHENDHLPPELKFKNSPSVVTVSADPWEQFGHPDPNSIN